MKLPVLLIVTLLSACAQQPPATKPSAATPSTPSVQPAPAAAPNDGRLDLTDLPAERALIAGIRAYEDADYTLAESQLLLAVRTGLRSPKDTAAAMKYLAFIYCSSDRYRQCESAFRDAFDADPDFSLSKSEAGHPQWGSVYQRAAKP